MIFIQRSAEPDILASQGKTVRDALCSEYDNGAREFSSTDFKNNIYGDETVRKELEETMQHYKCCYCEKRIESGHIEHFRPKAGYKQCSSEKSLQKPGYYWLAYQWDNLLLSCKECNQDYKKNLFPLLNSKNRARSHYDDINTEEPLLINPSKVDPQIHIGFRSEIPYAINASIYGKTTISYLGLDRERLNEDRRTKLAEIILLVDLVKLAENEKRVPDSELQLLAKQAKKKLAESMSPCAEYSAMINAYLSTSDITRQL